MTVRQRAIDAFNATPTAPPKTRWQKTIEYVKRTWAEFKSRPHVFRLGRYSMIYNKNIYSFSLLRVWKGDKLIFRWPLSKGTYTISAFTPSGAPVGTTTIPVSTRDKAIAAFNSPPQGVGVIWLTYKGNK